MPKGKNIPEEEVKRRREQSARDRANLRQGASENPQTPPHTIQPEPWYESNLFWGAGALASGLVVAVIGAMLKDVRWLLWLSGPLFIPAIWMAFKGMRRPLRHAATLGLSLATIIGLVDLYRALEPKMAIPSSQSISPRAKNDTIPKARAESVQQPPSLMHPYDLDEKRQEYFNELLRTDWELDPAKKGWSKKKGQPDRSAVLRIGCWPWSERSCIVAGKFLESLSSSGWRIDGNKVHLLQAPIPHDGVTLVNHTDNQTILPPHLGLWELQTSTSATLDYAFNMIGLPVHYIVVFDLPIGTTMIYFGPEPTSLHLTAPKVRFGKGPPHD